MAQTAARQGGARVRSRHALKDQGKGAAFTSLCGLSRARARGADRPAPGAAAASTAVADSFFRFRTAGAVGGAGDGAGRATGTSPTRWPKPQHGKGGRELAR